ncbi:Hsp33 family molecular chaperone HslO [Holzapfeliella floricola]|uniref:33 kDa chaperonin n=1 Tax=Holzapfeliella floricola DSM 23037 = JCM 16512 TaxID=1423744 RepID=A0A0R2DJQ7_9LACO|nr:Hsp33 family molecular chaperone HslO [Holzapfeliella floricola]KRN04302.1 33 kda chaperonin (heat shock protein 33 like protein) (hsp33) [Holzapfeliella floricola DSM 23037 = JCM 16512]
MKDYLIKAISKDKAFRILAVSATELVSTAQQKHDTYSASSAALGRGLIGTLLLSTATLKGDDTLTVRIQGDGPAGAMVMDGNADGMVKGYIQNPHVHLPLNEKGKIDVKGAVGTNGMFSVTKDLHMKEPFTGQVPLISGELGEDFTYYLAKSEQIPSAVGLSCFVNPNNTIGAAGGFMIQVLPNASEESIAKLEDSLKQLPLVSKLVREGKTPEEITEMIFPEGVDILDTMDVTFKCDCSKERFEKSLATLKKSEIEAMIEEDHGAEAVCKFCNAHYHYSESDLKDILAKRG